MSIFIPSTFHWLFKEREKSWIRLCAACSSGIYVCLPAFLFSSSYQGHREITLFYLVVFVLVLKKSDRFTLLLRDYIYKSWIKHKDLLQCKWRKRWASFGHCGTQTCSCLSIDFLLSLESVCKLHLDISRACLCNVILALTPAPPFPTPPHRLRHTKCLAKDH